MKLRLAQVFVIARLLGSAISFPDILSVSAHQLTHFGLCQTSTQSNTIDETEVYGLWVKSIYPDPYPSGRGIMVHPTAATINFGSVALTQSSVDPSIFNSTATAQYVTYRGYFWVAFVFRRVSPYAANSNCILSAVVYDTVSIGATQQLTSNLALSNLLGVLSHYYTYLNNPNDIQIVSAGNQNFNSIGSTSNSYTIGTRTIFKQPLTDAHWADPKLRRGLRYGFTQYATDSFNLDMLTSFLSTGFKANGSLITRDHMVYSRRDSYNAYGFMIYPGTTITRTAIASAANPGFMSVIHVYGANKLLTTAGARVVVSQGCVLTVQASQTIADVTGDVVLLNDGSGGLLIQFENVSWKFYLTNGSNPVLATNQASVQIGTLTSAMVSQYLKVMILTSVQYTGNGASEPNNFDGLAWIWVTVMADLPVTTAQATVQRMEAYMKSTFSIVSTNYTNKYLDFSSINTALTYKNCVPAGDNYNLTMFSQVYFSGFPDWEDLVTGFTYNPAYNGNFYRQMPPAYLTASSNLYFSYQIGYAFTANCAFVYDFTVQCVHCNTGYYPDISDYKSLPSGSNCRNKSTCLGLATDGFVYINNYEGTAYDNRGMCLACPPNCKSCNANLDCTQCNFPAAQNTADPRCACPVANCLVCNTTVCDLCPPFQYLTYDNRTGSRMCLSGCPQYFGRDTAYVYGTASGYNAYKCVRCLVQNCTSCTSDYTICNSYCTTNKSPVDYNFALAPDTAPSVACMSYTTQVSGYVYDPATTYFTICTSQNCTKCYATNLTDCDKCVVNKVYLVDHQRCTALAACPNGTYPQVGSTLRCWDCISDCTYCVDGSHDCINCASGMIYHEDSKTCIAPAMCSAAQKRAQVAKTKSGVSVTVCVNCMANCDTCTSKTICSQCATNYYFKTDSDPNLNVCQLCGRGCDQCFSGSDCQACTAGTDTFNIDLNICMSTVVCTAGSGYFISGGVCHNCMSNCQTCTSPTICTQCAAGRYFKTNTDPSLNTCELCGRGCAQCTSGSDCQACTAGTDTFNVDMNVCMSTTTCSSSPGYFILGGFCYNCMPNCQACTSHTLCTQCSTGRYFKTNPDPSLNTCELCGRGCNQCTSDSDCQLCTSGTDIFHVEANNCISSASCVAGSGMYSSAGMCHSCMSNCQTCTSPTICTQCAAGRYFKTNPDPTLNTCEMCGRGCAQCTSASNCQQCISGTEVFHTDQNICIQNTMCGTGSGSFMSGGICYSCLSYCADCTNSTTCLDCSVGKYLSKDATNCGDSCPSGENPISGTYRCASCAEGCSTCTPNGTYCLSCSAGTYFNEGRICVDCLQPGYSLEGSVCKSCEDKNCLLCPSDIRTCTDCKPTYLLANSKCKPCPAPMFLDIDSECQPCYIENCGQCANTSKTCASCQGGYYLEGGRCTLAVLRISATAFDKKTSTIKITFEHRLFADDYQSLVVVNLEDSEGNKQDVMIENVRVEDGKLLVKISSPASFSGGIAFVIFSNPFRFFSADKPGYSLASESVAAQVQRVSMNYPQETTSQYFSHAVAAPGVSLLTILMMVVAKNYAIMLIKIYQMMEFMQLYNLVYPRNFRGFISVFQASNPFDFIPDILAPLHSEKNCPLMDQKLADEGMGCQFISNAKPTIIVVFCWVILALIFKAICKVIGSKNYSPARRLSLQRPKITIIGNTKDVLNLQGIEICPNNGVPRLPLKVKLYSWILKTNDTLSSMKAVFLLMQLLDMDIILAMAINLKYYPGDKDRSLANVVNIILSGTVFIGFPILIGVFFARTKSALKDPKGPDSYLLEERTTTNFFTVHHEVLIMSRNFVGCVMTVWLYEKPTLQIVSLAILLGTFGVFEFKYRVLVSKFGSISMGLLSTLYSLSSLVLLIAKIFENNIKQSAKLNGVGYPLILLFTCIIGVNFAPSVYELYKTVKRRCKRSKSRVQNERHEIPSEDTKTLDFRSNRHLSDEFSSGSPAKIETLSSNDVNRKEGAFLKPSLRSSKFVAKMHIKGLSGHESSIGGFSDSLFKSMQEGSPLREWNSRSRSKSPLNQDQRSSHFSGKTPKNSGADVKMNFFSHSKLLKRHHLKSISPKSQIPLDGSN